MLTALLANSKSFWMPEKASTVSGEVDSLFGFIYWICFFFFALITVLTVYFVLRYRHKKGQVRDTSGAHSTALELTWTIIPTILVVIIFYQGFRGYMNMAIEPPNPYEISVTARSWSWSFRYPTGANVDELHLPVGVPVRLVLSSDDVIHSLYVPAFRVKKDAVPGRYNRFWVQATEATRPDSHFDLYCAEYCGVNHSVMFAKVVVHPDIESFEAWLREAGKWEGKMSPIDAGKMIIDKYQCLSCHAVDGDKGPKAPTFRNLFGSQVPTEKHGSVLADENYIRESILYPQAKLHAGYQGIMSPFERDFSGPNGQKDLDAVMAYLKSISIHFKGDLSAYKKIAAPATGPSTAPATQQSGGPATQPSAK